MTTPHEDTVVRYLAWMRARHLSGTTITNRRVILRRIGRSLDRPLAQAAATDLETWATRRADQVGAVALRNEISTMQCFYAWLVEAGARRSDPSRTLRRPRLPRRLPRAMSEQDFARALTCASDQQTLAMIALGGMAGLRACEVAGLAWSDVDLTGASLTVVSGKGGHARVVPIPAELVAILAALPHRRGPVIRRLDGALGHCKPHNISHRGNDYLHGLGITATFHQLRHRTGTVAYQATLDLLAVQQLLGHVSSTTTAGYAAAQSASVRAAADALGQVAS